ncbi:hypothetical protein ACHAXM_001126 [Skeletonema potamos]
MNSPASLPSLSCCTVGGTEKKKMIFYEEWFNLYYANITKNFAFLFLIRPVKMRTHHQSTHRTLPASLHHIAILNNNRSHPNTESIVLSAV